MGAPVPELNPEFDPAHEATTEAFLSPLRTIAAPERRKHASVYNYWLTIRGSRDFPPMHDLDPLEISDASAFSVLLEMIGGGEDAEIRHVGRAIGSGVHPDKVSEAPNPSLLSCIATRLPVVAACRDAFAFEDEFETADGKARCWVTLLPFSATGTWIDFVYGFVSLGGQAAAAQAEPEASAEPESPASLSDVLELADRLAADHEVVEQEAPEEEQVEPAPEVAETAEEPGPDEAPAEEPLKATISEKFFEKIANIGGFYGRPVEVEFDPETAKLESWEGDEPPAAKEPHAPDAAKESPSSDELAPADELSPTDELAPADDLPSPVESAPADDLLPSEEAPSDEASPANDPSPMLEGTLENKLSDVRAKADEARQAKLRANAALYEGLSAAYDFALDAEDSPEEYLKLVQAEGLKIQLRSPMKPVAKLAFNGMCDDITIKQLEAILAWAFDEEVPRGALAERIETEGGIAPILNRESKAA
jgi:hypothetical protein